MNRKGEDVYSTELCPLTLTRRAFMEHLISKIDAYEEHIWRVNLQAQTERLWQQHKQHHQCSH